MGQFDDIAERDQFLDLLRRGVGPINAGVEVGWSPAKTRRIMGEPEMAELILDAEERKDETAEQSLFKQVKKGNMTAIAMWLYNRQPGKWRDIRRVQVETKTSIEIGVVHSVKQAAVELLREHGVAALQPGGALDAAVGEIVDAEVVEDDRHPDA